MTIEPGRQIGSFLSAHHVMSLAILGPGGPHATSLFYDCDGLAPLWPSDPGTQHSREIEADPRVAATVAPDYADLAAIRGVRVTGAAPWAIGDGAVEFREANVRTAVYRLHPARIVLIDNTKGFGHKETLKLSP